jgi:glucose-6-phosphate 1-dehydrogenase
MKYRIKNHIIVIFGASGDLAKHKLLPAIYSIYKGNKFLDKQLILGAGRSSISDEMFRENTLNQLLKNLPDEKDSIIKFCDNLFFQTLDTSKETEYLKIKARIQDLQEEYNIDDNILFYLSTPPKLYYVIPEFLAKVGLNDRKDGFKRIIIEKPFGEDEQTARSLNKHLLKYYREKQLFRIDHYLGKETVQNLLVFRFANAMFEPLWNANYIENIQIYANESVGISDRGGYYDGVGAIKDMVQNHMLQLLCISAMEPPISMDSQAIRNESLNVLKSIRAFVDDEDIAKNIVVAQYLGDANNKCYKEELNISKESTTETYAAIRLYIDNWRWKNMPFYIRTGKRLSSRVSEVVVNFKGTPHSFFSKSPLKDISNNQLIIRIQPDEGIKLKFLGKTPGTGFATSEVEMNFSYKDMGLSNIPPAYERLILDALLGDNTLFARNDAVEAAWSIIDPISDLLSRRGQEFLKYYETGSYGPKEADELLSEQGHLWRNPTEKLSKVK